jgi:hypothetical protein
VSRPAQVSVDGGHLDVRLDGDALAQPTARINYLNIYNVTTSVVAQVHNVLAGTLVTDISARGISGEIRLQGSSGFDGPGISSYYTATFTGPRTS